MLQRLTCWPITGTAKIGHDMHGELFDSTIPFGEPELLKASAFRRYLAELNGDSALGRAEVSRLTDFSPSLQADLQRFEQRGGGYEVVEAMAACVRHGARVTLHLQCAERVVPLTLFPYERLVHCPMPIYDLVAHHLAQMHVMHLEPALLRPPGDPLPEMVGDRHLHHPLNPLLWDLALKGPRSELLPEIAGPAVYRVSPGFEVHGLPMSTEVGYWITRLRQHSTSVSSIATWPGFDRERAARLLNALYLQAGLIVSRSHPDAVREAWL